MVDAATNIPAFRTMLEGIGFTISASTSISNQEGINQFSKIKALSNDRQCMRQDEHLIAVVCKLSVVQDGHVINACAQSAYVPQQSGVQPDPYLARH